MTTTYTDSSTCVPEGETIAVKIPVEQLGPIYQFYNAETAVEKGQTMHIPNHVWSTATPSSSICVLQEMETFPVVYSLTVRLRM